jgi:FlaA1/EpsC-like NDP-sugar epimerase
MPSAPTNATDEAAGIRTQAAALLGRPPITRDDAAASNLIAGRAVLITGAGGSIGGDLAQAIAALGPARLALLDHAEYPLWRVGQALAEEHPRADHRAIVADIRDAARLRQVFAAFRPDLVFHAAALKHVPIVEAHPLEGLLSNAIGTRHVLDAAIAVAARTVVVVSTDKAVAPASVMGASKRLAEMYGQAADRAMREDGGATRCVSLRCGNVLGSTGSVAQIFARQLAQGTPLTVTHPDMRRFFITPDEAVRLLLDAARMAENGPAPPGPVPPGPVPPGAVLLAQTGPAIRILDLARAMARAAGRCDGPAAFRVTAPRPGERLDEAMHLPAETPLPLPAPGLSAIAPRGAALPLLARAFDELEAACRAGQASGNPALALALVSRLIPDFDHCPEARADRLRA